MSVRSVGARLLTRFPAADGIFRRLVWSRLEFPEPEMRFINELPNNSIDIAVDVGAARGAYSWILSRKARQVFAFEPGEQHARYLESAVGRSNIHVVKAAVGSSCGKAHLYTPGSSEQAPYLATLSKANPIVSGGDIRVRVVQQTTLDSFFANTLENGSRIDLMKVDVEGYELEVLKGAERLIARHSPLILCEIEQRHNRECAAVFQRLRSAGYRAHIYQGKGFRRFEGNSIEHLQSEAAATAPSRTEPRRYINNFVFAHERSRIALPTEGAA